MDNKKKKSLVESDRFQQLLAASFLVILLIVFSILAREKFFSFTNIVNIALATSVTGVLAIGVTFVLITGGNDLSIGTIMTVTGVISGIAVTNVLVPAFGLTGTADDGSLQYVAVILGVLSAILAGALVGLFNGFMVAKMKLPAFIATLGTQLITKGLALLLSGTKPIYFNDTPAYQNIALGNIIPGFDVPNAIVIFILCAIFASLILSKTLLGRYNYAIGSNEEAARLSGIQTDKYKMIIYSICGAFAGLAGILMSSRLNSAQPATGVGYELDAIAAAVIGGTSLNGGEGSIIGTVIGAFLMSVLTNGLRVMSVPQELQTVITGFILILAVYIDILRRSSKK